MIKTSSVILQMCTGWYILKRNDITIIKYILYKQWRIQIVKPVLFYSDLNNLLLQQSVNSTWQNQIHNLSHEHNYRQYLACQILTFPPLC